MFICYAFRKKRYYIDSISAETMYIIDSNPCPWQNFWIEVYSEPIGTIPIHSDMRIRAKANHAEPIRKTFCILFNEKRSKINPT